MAGSIDKAAAEEAMRFVWPAIERALADRAVLNGCMHVVIMDPRMTASSGATFESAILHEVSAPSREAWDADYAHYARHKAAISWRTGRDSHTVQAVRPHLLRDDDERVWAASASTASSSRWSRCPSLVRRGDRDHDRGRVEGDRGRGACWPAGASRRGLCRAAPSAPRPSAGESPGRRARRDGRAGLRTVARLTSRLGLQAEPWNGGRGGELRLLRVHLVSRSLRSEAGLPVYTSRRL